SPSLASVSRSRAAVAASSRFRAMRRAAPGAGAARRFSGRLVMRGAQQPEVFGTEKPVERRRAVSYRARELEQAGRALAQLQERLARVGEERTNQSAQIGLVAHDRNAAARVPGGEPTHHA